MKFKLLLFAVGLKIKKRLKKDPEYKKKISEKNCSVQFKTADNLTGRYFTFKDGHFFTKKGIIIEPSVSLIWKDASTGFSILTSADAPKKIMDDLMKNSKYGSLRYEGDGAIAFWFFSIL